MSLIDTLMVPRRRLTFVCTEDRLIDAWTCSVSFTVTPTVGCLTDLLVHHDVYPDALFCFTLKKPIEPPFRKQCSRAA